jgi:hypothetical protein
MYFVLYVSLSDAVSERTREWWTGNPDKGSSEVDVARCKLRTYIGWPGYLVAFDPSQLVRLNRRIISSCLAPHSHLSIPFVQRTKLSPTGSLSHAAAGKWQNSKRMMKSWVLASCPELISPLSATTCSLPQVFHYRSSLPPVPSRKITTDYKYLTKHHR